MNSELFTLLHNCSSKLELDFTNYSKNIVNRKAKWEKFDQQYKRTSGRVIKLNVGGYKHSIGEEYLFSKPESKIKQIYEESLNLMGGEADEVFIDRPGKYFYIIANYLRGHEIQYNQSDTFKLSGLLEEAAFYELKDLADNLLVYEDFIKNPTHNHQLEKTKIVKGEVWKCRGPLFFDNENECKQGDLFINYKYICNNSKCKSGKIEYCYICAARQDNQYKHKQHSCSLSVDMRNTGWACNCKYLKDKCVSGFNDFYKSNGETAFTCRSCDFDMCEKCFVHYKNA